MSKSWIDMKFCFSPITNDEVDFSKAFLKEPQVE